MDLRILAPVSLLLAAVAVLALVVRGRAQEEDNAAKAAAASPMRPLRKTCVPRRTGSRRLWSIRSEPGGSASTMRQRMAFVPTSIAAKRVTAPEG